MNETDDSCANRADAPAPYIVLFDPQCRICQAGIARLRRLDKHHRTNPVPLSSSFVSDNPEFSPAEIRRRLHIVCPNGETMIGFQAVVELAGLFPSTRFLARIAAFPLVFAIGNALYDFLASHRYFFGRCENDQCSL